MNLPWYSFKYALSIAESAQLEKQPASVLRTKQQHKGLSHSCVSLFERLKPTQVQPASKRWGPNPVSMSCPREKTNIKTKHTTYNPHINILKFSNIHSPGLDFYSVTSCSTNRFEPTVWQLKQQLLVALHCDGPWGLSKGFLSVLFSCSVTPRCILKATLFNNAF